MLQNTLGAKNRGNVLVRATDEVVLDNTPILAGVSQQTAGKGGNITLKIGQFTLSRDDLGVISASTRGQRDFGDSIADAGR